MFVCLTSLSIIISMSILVATRTLFHSFLLLSNIPLQIYTIHHTFFSHSSADGHLGCFHVLAFVIGQALFLKYFLKYNSCFCSKPKSWVGLLVGVGPKDTTKPKIWTRKNLLLAASKENSRDLSLSSVLPNIQIRKF